MVTGPSENKKDGQQENKPILLSFALITDFLIIGFSVALILLMTLNMPKLDQTDSFEKPDLRRMFGVDTFVQQTLKIFEKIEFMIKQIADAMAFGLFSTFFVWITSMFCGLYSMTIFFGKKYNWPCCPQMKDQIQRELFGFPIEDEKFKNIKIEV